MRTNKRTWMRFLSWMLMVIMTLETVQGNANLVFAANAGTNQEIETENQEVNVGTDEQEITSEYDKENLEILFEAEEERDVSTKHYRLSDGSMMAADYGMAVHYEDDGEWKEIDNRFVYEAATENDPMEGFATAEGDTRFKFAAESGNGGAVRAETGDYSVSFQFLGGTDVATPAAVNDMELNAVENTEESVEKEAAAISSTITFIKGEVLNAEDVPDELAVSSDSATGTEVVQNTISSYAAGYHPYEIQQNEIQQSADLDEEGLWMDTGLEQSEETGESLVQQAAVENAVTSVGYEDVQPGVSLQYIAKGNSLKEYILVAEPQDSYEYSFRLELGGLEAVQGEDERISLYDSELGTEVFEIPASYMTDAAGAYSDAVEMVLTKESENSCILTITADKEWIEDEERVFPVAIDPTLNERLSTSSSIRGFYVIEEKPTKISENYGSMYVGYDGSGYGEYETYIQLKDLAPLPKDSVICASVFNMAVLRWDEKVCPKLHVKAVEVTGATSWSSSYSYNTRPATGTAVLDMQTIVKSDVNSRYVGWDITELVKKHYSEGNVSGDVFAFALKPAVCMSDSGYVNAALNLKWDGAEPVLQTFYRDTKGVEGYYTYQTQDAGRAGVGYVNDYTLQLAFAKNIASYNNSAMTQDVSIVYNSSNSGSYFTNGGSIHTKDFSMNTGAGWKLNLQETVVPVEVEDLESTTEYLVYNDSDGTEHYFRYNSEESRYEDEDGLGLAITKSGSDFIMKDKQDNEKFFAGGYLTRISDANGNRVDITYDNNKITKVTLDTMDEEPVVLYEFEYHATLGCLTYVKDFLKRTHEFSYTTGPDGKYRLAGVLWQPGASDTKVWEAQYTYDRNGKLLRAFDPESKNGIEYTYYKSDTGYRIYSFAEFAAGYVSAAAPAYGIKVQAWPLDMKQTRYRYCGADLIMSGNGVESEDDIVTTYTFNSSGNTINVRSENWSEDKILGVSASAYEKKNGTAAKNNRMNAAVSSGQAGRTLLANGGLEREGSEASEAEGWSDYTSQGNAARKTDGASTGNAHSGICYQNLWGDNTSSISNIYQDISVEQGETYTFSAYVNTKQLTEARADGGVYLYAKYANEADIRWKSWMLDYKTDQTVNGGWQRLTLTFTAPQAGTVRFVVCSHRVHGLVRVDDIQLETGSAASSFNHVYNGNFEIGGSKGWTVSDGSTVTTAAGGGYCGDTALQMNAFVPETSLCASQTISLYRSSDTTFLLSGWGKGDALPDPAEEIVGKNDSTLRYWGMTLTLNYSDGTAPEHFHLPFCDYATNWQYAAMAIAPKAVNKTITTAELKLYYQNNANQACFDGISLIEEPAQTYKYDKDGNMVSVKSSGNGEEAYEFKDGTMDLLKATTEGSGDYEYVYNTEGNTHLPKTIKNDTVSMDITYNSEGNSLSTKLSDASEGGTDKYMESKAEYDNGLLQGTEDQAGNEVEYLYDEVRRVRKVIDARRQLSIKYDDRDRIIQNYQSGVAAVSNTYEDGNLKKIQRKGYTKEGTAKTLDYQFVYDGFGRNTSVSVGGQRLTGYQYDGSGLLTKTEYGNGSSPLATTEYVYDDLERVEEELRSDHASGETVRYGYRYASDGSLAAMSENGELLHTYEYDTLGRLIHSSTLKDGKQVLRTAHTYDTSNRILSQSWQIGADAFTESYAYEEKDGTLKTMTTGGDVLNYTYDGLKRLSSRTSPVLNVSYGYRDITGTDRTTTQIKTISYTKNTGGTAVIPALGYTYDNVGNITAVTSGGSSKNAYVYDAQNQLVSETIYGFNGGNVYGSYTYDTDGNIRTLYTSYYGIESESTTLEYGNSSWGDLLTKVTYEDRDGNVSSGDLTYDQIGNPTEYFNGQDTWDFTWKYGRRLTGASNGTKTIAYGYDSDGIRRSKTVNGVEYEYITLSGKVVRETLDDAVVDYYYDEQGRPYKISVAYGSRTYDGYYVLNQQGDVINILDNTGGVAVTYDYNAWGRILKDTKSGTFTSTILQEYNHLKYRGYFHDEETGLYYVSSRYYDPEVGRFISADTTDILGVQRNLYDKNLYAYCDNNPIVRRDESGAIWETVFDIISLGASIMDVAANPKDPWAWAGLVGDAIDLIPVVTGAGEIIRGLKTVGRISETVDTVTDVKKGWKLGDDISNLTKAGNTPSWSTVRQRFWKNEALNNSMNYSKYNNNRMKKGLAPIGNDGYSMELHHPKGRNGDNYWNFYPVTYTEHKRIHYGR